MTPATPQRDAPLPFDPGETSFSRANALYLAHAADIAYHRNKFIERGFDRARVDAVGRGEREPVVAVPDNTAEPRNRRAEITIR